MNYALKTVLELSVVLSLHKAVHVYHAVVVARTLSQSLLRVRLHLHVYDFVIILEIDIKTDSLCREVRCNLFLNLWILNMMNAHSIYL